MADLVHYTKDTIFPGAFITCGGGPVIFASRRAQGSETKGTAPPLSSLTQRREQADKAADVRHERRSGSVRNKSVGRSSISMPAIGSNHVVSGLAFQLKTRLRRLAVERGVTPTAINIPWQEHTPFPQLLAGVCSDTSVIDADRMRMTRGALRWDQRDFPRCCIGISLTSSRGASSSSSGAPGEVRIREYLWCEAWVGHPLARRCNAFSVAISVEAYTLLDVEKLSWHRRITAGTIAEISMTSEPACASAVVHERRPSGAMPEWEVELGLEEEAYG